MAGKLNTDSTIGTRIIRLCEFLLNPIVLSYLLITQIKESILMDELEGNIEGGKVI